MKISTIFLINTIIAWFFGLALLLFPVDLSNLYGAELTDEGIFYARMFGAALLGFGVLTWQFRFADATKERRDVVLSLLFADALSTVIALIGQLQGVVNFLGWTTVLIYLLLSADNPCHYRRLFTLIVHYTLWQYTSTDRAGFHLYTYLVNPTHAGANP